MNYETKPRSEINPPLPLKKMSFAPNKPWKELHGRDGKPKKLN
jgi:hypothetical protein